MVGSEERDQNNNREEGVDEDQEEGRLKHSGTHLRYSKFVGSCECE